MMTRTLGSLGLTGLLGLALVLSGCSRDEPSPFGSGGQGFEGFDDGDDTGSTDTGDTGEVSEDAPVITSLRAAFEDYGGTTAFEIGIAYTDPNDDVVGGQVRIEITDESTSESVSISEEIGGQNAELNSDGEIILATSSLDSSVDYTVSAVLEDLAGNSSAAASVSTSESSE